MPHPSGQVEAAVRATVEQSRAEPGIATDKDHDYEAWAADPHGNPTHLAVSTVAFQGRFHLTHYPGSGNETQEQERALLALRSPATSPYRQIDEARSMVESKSGLCPTNTPGAVGFSAMPLKSGQRKHVRTPPCVAKR